MVILRLSFRGSLFMLNAQSWKQNLGAIWAQMEGCLVSKGSRINMNFAP